MVQRHARGVGQAGRRARHIGIVDIGSNSIRLVVFDGLSRIPHPLFNEKVLCGLGRGLERTGKLNPDGVVLALENLARFAALARAMNVRHLRVVGTAAVRDAEDGRAFAAEVKRRAGLKIEILDGAEEARLSALGVLSGIPDADGLTGDLGGGSLELIRLDRGALREHDTLPFGPLRLRELADKGRGKLRDMIDEHLAALKWLSKAQRAAFLRRRRRVARDRAAPHGARQLSAACDPPLRDQARQGRGVPRSGRRPGPRIARAADRRAAPPARGAAAGGNGARAHPATGQARIADLLGDGPARGLPVRRAEGAAPQARSAACGLRGGRRRQRALPGRRTRRCWSGSSRS